MATLLTSYDLKGKKDSFANWISNLSPVDTFFVSVTGKEQVKNTLFQWQTDRLDKPKADNWNDESDVVVPETRKPTKVYENTTQILRRSLEVTDTADVIAHWGRGKELAYQMEKAGKEIKRDLETILLLKGQESNKTTSAKATLAGEKIDKDGTVTTENAAAGTPRKTSTFGALVAKVSTAAAGADQSTVDTDGSTGIRDVDTGAIVHMKTAASNTIKEEELFDITYNLYLAGSDADIIMFHPKHASFFSSLMEVGGKRTKLIDNMDTTLNKFVGTVIDPLGQSFKLVPNRFMPEDVIYFFNPKDWTQMVLREPEKVKLAKHGSSERYMIEMEVGLRHRDPWASGILEIKA